MNKPSSDLQLPYALAAARAAGYTVAALHFGAVVQEVSIADLPDDASVWLPWAEVCPCTSCQDSIVDDDWYCVAIFAAEIASLRTPGNRKSRKWSAIKPLGDDLVLDLLLGTFDPLDPLCWISELMQDEMSSPPTLSELKLALAEGRKHWMKAINVVKSHELEIESLAELLQRNGSVDRNDVNVWWKHTHVANVS